MTKREIGKLFFEAGRKDFQDNVKCVPALSPFVAEQVKQKTIDFSTAAYAFKKWISGWCTECAKEPVPGLRV